VKSRLAVESSEALFTFHLFKLLKWGLHYIYPISDREDLSRVLRMQVFGSGMVMILMMIIVLLVM
jgi:hypothetical protein